MFYFLFFKNPKKLDFLELYFKRLDIHDILALAVVLEGAGGGDEAK